MMDPRPWDPMSRMAGAAVVASLLLFLGTVAGAWMIAPLPYTGAADSSVWVAGNGNHSSPIPPRAIRTVADNNPFRPGRDRPPSRYLPPSQRVLASQVTARPAVFVPAFVLEGIAWTPGRPGVAGGPSAPGGG